MKKSEFKNYNELPLFLNAQIVSRLLGISIASSYEIMRSKHFPTINIGSRIVIPRDKFIQWVDEQTKK